MGGSGQGEGRRRRYLGLDVLARAQAVDHNTEQEVTQPGLRAITA